MGGDCGKCGAKRIDSQLGLEPTPEEYVAKLVAVFREVRRVLRKDGTLWLNLGDSYARQGGQANAQTMNDMKDTHRESIQAASPPAGLKSKDLVGIPWRVAFALQSDGWWLRQDIVWSKRNCMPESMTDRCTKSHEYIFLLTKSARYYFDNEAIKEPNTEGTIKRLASGPRQPMSQGPKLKQCRQDGGTEPYSVPNGRNKRDVWTISTKPYKGAHFAVFPPALIEPCILAGTSEKGCCKKCGAPWERVMDIIGREVPPGGGAVPRSKSIEAGIYKGMGSSSMMTDGAVNQKRTTGWRPTCDCNEYDMRLPPDDPAYVPLTPVPCTVLDPFGGSGTTGEVAEKHGRNSILIELNPSYVELAKRRTIKRIPVMPGDTWTEPT